MYSSFATLLTFHLILVYITLNLRPSFQNNDIGLPRGDCLVSNSSRIFEIVCPNKVTMNVYFVPEFLTRSVFISCYNDEFKELFPNINDARKPRAYIRQVIYLTSCSVIRRHIIPFIDAGSREWLRTRIYSSGLGTTYALNFEEGEFVDFNIYSFTLFFHLVKQLPGNLFPNTLTDMNIVETNLTVLPENIFKNTPNLSNLELKYTELKTLPATIFHGLKQLTALSLDGNELRTLDSNIFYGLEKLQTLVLSNNQFESLPIGIFSSLVQLEDLNLNGNRFVYLDFLLTLPNLMGLNLTNNVLRDNSLRAITELLILSPRIDILIINNCSLTHISSEFMYAAQNVLYLDLSNNEIETLPVTFFYEFRFLSLFLDNNKLQQIPRNMIWNKDLQELSLRNNSLVEVPKTILQNLSLTIRIDLSYNKIRYLHPDTFRGTFQQPNNQTFSETYLKYQQSEILVEYTANTVKEIRKSYLLPNITRPGISHTFSELEQKDIRNKELLLHNNMLEEIHPYTFQNLPELVILDLSYNNIKSLHNESFNGTHNLIILYLNNNKLSIVSGMFLLLHKLQILNLSYNHISSVEENIFINNPFLERLDLSHNKLGAIKRFSNDNLLASLKSLSLRNNELSFIDSPNAFRFLHGLIYLDLANNKVDKLRTRLVNLYGAGKPIFMLPQLQYLDLSNNSIPKIWLEWRQAFISLSYLNLSYNKIEEISIDDLRYKPFNLTVDVQNNLIKSIDLEYSELNVGTNKSNSSVSVNLNHNPLHCTCNIFTFLKLQDDDISIWNYNLNVGKIRSDNLSCSEPRMLSGKNVDHVEDWAPHLLSLFGLCYL